MPKVLSTREETSEEKRLREWFETQTLESPKNLEEAARLLIGLITGLLGALFGVLTVAAENIPAYLTHPVVQGLGVAAVALWLGALLCGLVVVTPRKWQTDAGQPTTQRAVFQGLLAHKAWWLRAAVLLFAPGVLALGAVLVIALLSV